MTWLFLIIWAILISFGILSAAYPAWLEDWASLGILSESVAYKKYGDGLLHSGEYGKAVAQYSRALEIDPENHQAMVNLAVAYRHLGRNRKSAEMLLRASRLDSQDQGLVSFNLGELAELADRPAEALAYYQRAIGGIIDQDLVYRKIGLIHLKAGRLDEALQAFEKTLAIQTDVRAPYRRMLLQAYESNSADSHTRESIRRQLIEGPADEDLARYDMSILKRLRNQDPEIAKTLNHLGYIYYQMNDLTAARDRFDQSLAIWPGNKDAVNGLAAVRTRGISRADSGTR